MLIYKPELLNDLSQVTAGFTLSGRQMVHSESTIPGYNFGDNTPVPDEEIKTNIQHLFGELCHTGGIAMAEQVHGNKVKIVHQPGFYRGFDGFVSNTPNLLLGIKVADCAAVLIADPENGIVAAAHAGWKGAAAGITANTVKTMNNMGAELSKSRVYISPCISQSNFEVGEEVAQEFPDHLVDRTIGPKPYLDLRGFIFEQLTEAGIHQDHIQSDGRCTVRDNQFYSYRRERDRAGRMLGFIKLNKNK